MNQLQKYTWLIETIRRSGKITHKDLSLKWERNKDLSDCKPLSRATFNRWRDAIYEQFGININCQKTGGYYYYISNPENLEKNKLKNWMLDSFAVGNTINEHLSLKDRIIINEIPSGHFFLTTILEAMKDNCKVNISYHPFNKPDCYSFPIEPYCVKLFENRWYVLGKNNRDEIKIYGLDRIESAEISDEKFKLPEDFNAAEYFSTVYGIVINDNVKPQRIIIRAYNDHKYYLMSLPLHHSQCLIKDYGEYADFELYLTPTYDFIMKLLQSDTAVEVKEPASLRKNMKDCIYNMYKLYKDD